MAAIKKESSFTNKQLETFNNNSKKGDCIFCSKATGFGVVKNRTSLSFFYRRTSSDSNRSRIVIGLAHKITIEKAVKIAKEMFSLDNAGNNPKDALRTSTKDNALRTVTVPDNDLSYLGNFYEQVYTPYVHKHKYGSALNNINLIKFEFGHLFRKKMSELTSQDIEDWQDKIEKRESNGKPLVYNTIKRKYDTLLGLLSIAIQLSNKPNGKYAGLLYESPFKVRALRGANNDQKREYEKKQKELDRLNRRIMEDSELSAIEKALFQFSRDTSEARTRSRQHTSRKHLPDLASHNFAHWILPFIYLCYYTGMRPNDVLDLRWEDFYNGKLTVTANKSRNYKEPIVIRQYISDQKRLFKYSCKEVLDLWQEDNGSPATGWVFPSDADRNKRLGRDGYKKSWATIQKLAGIQIHVYSFRHHFISYQLSIGSDKIAVAHLVGHKTTRMIDEHYSHHLPNKATDALNQM